MLLSASALIALGLAACTRLAPTQTPQAARAPEVTLTPQASGTDALLIGTSAVSSQVAWASGTRGTVLRTTDGGHTWQNRSVPNADSLQFRDVEAMSAQVAYVLSIGAGSDSRIYKTTDGGASWTLQYQSDDPQAFFDCMAFWDTEGPRDSLHGFAFSDAVEGPDGTSRFVLLTTTDGGTTWTRVPADSLPPAFEGEGSFAASGTCATAQGERHGWIGTGNAAGQPARVLYTTDRGQTWQTAPVPIDAGEAAGIASVVFRDAQHGLALGGDIGAPIRTDSSAARTADGGRSWQRAASPAFEGPVYGAAHVPGTPTPTLVAVGPGGVSYSTDDARSWTALDTTAYWGAAFANPEAGWLAGPEGRLTRVRFRY